MDAEEVFLAGPLIVSPLASCEARLGDRRLPLSARQVRMLALLLRAGGRLLSREDLYEGATGRPLPDGSRAVDMDLWRIRRALGPFSSALRSVRKVGWALDASTLAAPALVDGETDS